MGLFHKAFQQARRPEGALGKPMLSRMNAGYASKPGITVVTTK